MKKVINKIDKPIRSSQEVLEKEVFLEEKNFIKELNKIIGKLTEEQVQYFNYLIIKLRGVIRSQSEWNKVWKELSTNSPDDFQIYLNNNLFFANERKKIRRKISAFLNNMI